MAKEQKLTGPQSPWSFLVKGFDGVSLNTQHVLTRGQMWLADQKFKLTLWKKRPDLRGALLHYPLRDPLPRSYQQLYNQAARDVRRTLRKWHHPWVIVPSCSFALSLDGTAVYNTYRHDIKVELSFKYWHRQIHVFLPLLQAAMRLVGRGEHQKVPWVGMGQGMMQRAALYRDLYEDVEAKGAFPGLLEVWENFIQELPPLLNQCAQSDFPPESLFAWYNSLRELNQELQQCLRATLIHELVHAWTRWTSYRRGKLTYRVVGLEDRSWEQTEADMVSSARIHVGLNEVLTEWLAEQLDWKIYGTTRLFSWRGLDFSSTYPAWIMNYVVLALEYHWKRLVDALPALKERRIANAPDFLYTLYFADPGLAGCFKAMLTLLGDGDECAFQKLSDACERFTGSGAERALLEQSFEDLRQLLAPILDFAVFEQFVPQRSKPEEAES